jgi:uncharacterized membrane protein
VAAATPEPDFLTAAATVGVIVAGVALLEAALVPGVVIGGAAMLAPRYLPRLRRWTPWRGAPRRPTAVPAQRTAAVADDAVTRAPFQVRQAVLKTITFRIIVTTLDFSANYIVIGEPATAAGLSAFALVAGPVFYFVHEAAWNRFGGPIVRPTSRYGIAINRALAKTITYRVAATTMEFTANYVVVRDLATAALLSSFGFVLGPFVYYGHEVLWQRFGTPRAPVVAAPAPLALPAPA